MILFLLDEFDVLVTVSSIGRALRSRSWTKKQIRRIVNELNADLHNQTRGVNVISSITFAPFPSIPFMNSLFGAYTTSRQVFFGPEEPRALRIFLEWVLSS
jgi:hypothetical protein